MPEKEFQKAYKSNHRLKTRVNNFHRQMESTNNSEDDFLAIRPEWTTVDRILACRSSDGMNSLIYLSANSFLYTSFHHSPFSNKHVSLIDCCFIKIHLDVFSTKFTLYKKEEVIKLLGSMKHDK